MLLLIIIVAIGLAWLVASVIGWVLSMIASVMFAVLVLAIAALCFGFALRSERQSGHYQA